jgi:hypothetical protein
MPDFDPLNASEVDELEKRLSGMSLSPTQRESERLLYACGQAAGRAQMVRRVRGARAVAALLGCTSAALLAALLLHENSPSVAAIDSTPRPVPQLAAVSTSTDGATARGTLSFASNQNRPLTVAAGFEELTLAELRPKIPTPHALSSKLPAAPVLSAAGPLPVEL